MPFFFLAGLGEHLGFAIWGEVPTLSLVIGSVIVAASGLFLLWRETAPGKRWPHRPASERAPSSRARPARSRHR